MLEKHHNERPVPRLATVYEEIEEPRSTHAVNITTPTRAPTEFESVYGYPPDQFCPELKAELNQRKAERVVTKVKPEIATTVEPPLSRQMFYIDALGLHDLVDEKFHLPLGKLIDKLSSGIPHPKDESFTQITADVWKSLFSSKTVERELKAKLVDTEDSYSAGRYSKGYRLKPDYQATLREAERHYEPASMSEPRAEVRHETKKGAKPKVLDMPCYLDIESDTARRMITEINAAITIIESGSWEVTGPLQSEGAITQLRARYSDDQRLVAGYLHRSLSLIHTVLDLSLNPNSQMKLEQCFRYSESGRWMGVGSGNLQNARKLARKIILAGHYSYDISSSTHSVMLELYEQQTGKKLPYLRDYVENKSEIRQKLGKHPANNGITASRIIS